MYIVSQNFVKVKLPRRAIGFMQPSLASNQWMTGTHYHCITVLVTTMQVKYVLCLWKYTTIRVASHSVINKAGSTGVR